MIRICNICLKTLEDETILDDDEDDRRSVVSSSPSIYAAHQHRQSLEALPTSPFAASQLFRKVEEPFNLFSIAETRPHLGSDISSRPATPADIIGSDPNYIPINRVAAPFRRLAQDEEADSVAIEATMNAGTGSINTPANENIKFPSLEDTGTSTIQFPGSSPEQGGDRANFPRARVDSDVDNLATPFLRSRVHSRLTDLGLLAGDAGWRTRRESTA
jgi:1-phosphatidylinositol-3-phosphate 5-kinase